MGKLSNYWKEYWKTPANSQRKRDLQIQINNIENWMINNKYKEPGTKTNWSKVKKNKYKQIKSKYGDFVGIAHRGHDIKYGYYRCDSCKYNKNPNCCQTCHDNGTFLSWIHI